MAAASRVASHLLMIVTDLEVALSPYFQLLRCIMHIGKLLAAAVMVSAPISLVSGQGNTPSDSGSQSHRGTWLAGAGAAAGAAIFLAFTNSGHGGAAMSNSFARQTPQPAPTVPTGGQGGNNTPNTFTEGSSTVPEPGSLALTATGIVGLIPLIRRRRR